MRARILLPTAVLFTITVAGMAVAAVQLYVRDMEKGQRERAELFAGMIANGITTAMLQGDAAKLPDLLEVAAGHRGDVESVSLIRPSGEVAFSSQQALAGTRPWAALPALGAKSLVRAPSGDPAQFAVLLPLENREACARCHGPASKVNGWLDVRFSRATVVAAERRLARTLLLTGAPALALLLAIAWWLVGREAIAPIQRLVRSMRRAESGEAGVRADEGRPDELGIAARGFDATLAALQRSRVELEDFYRERMIRAERFAAVGELATGLAHEIKNPLAGLSGALELMAEDLASMPKMARVVAQMQHQVKRVARVMEGLLDFARPPKPRLRETDVNATAERVAFLLDQQTRHLAIEFVRSLDPALPPALADAEQLEQVLLNICLNAVQAMGAGKGTLALRTSADAERVLVDVADTGPGIAPAARKDLFKPFHTTKKDGSGLGLAVSARIVADHGGQLDYHCPEGGGTIFTVKLRRADAAARSRAAEERGGAPRRAERDSAERTT